MIVKKHSTAADPIPWDLLQSVVIRLIAQSRYRDALMLAIPAYTGLRFSDYSPLRWGDLTGKEILVREKKTKKIREITLSDNLSEIINKCRQENDKSKHYIFANKKNEVFSIQYVNKQIKRINIEFKMGIENISSHSCRKCFATTLWENYGKSEEGLIMVAEILQHSSTSISRKYLGISKNKIRKAYSSL
jgi:integrase